MTEEVQLYLEEAQEKMEHALSHLDSALAQIRAGKASPRILDGVMVEYYGTMTPLSQVANITTPDGRTIAIQPWEKTMIGPIEKAIMIANLGFTPENNGELVRINIPALTEERRKDLVKQARSEGEDAKISIRNARRETIDQLKKLVKQGLSEDVEKDAETEVQKYTVDYGKKVDGMVENKEKDIMTV